MHTKKRRAARYLDRRTAFFFRGAVITTRLTSRVMHFLLDDACALSPASWIICWRRTWSPVEPLTWRAALLIIAGRSLRTLEFAGIPLLTHRERIVLAVYYVRWGFSRGTWPSDILLFVGCCPSSQKKRIGRWWWLQQQQSSTYYSLPGTTY